MGFIVLAIAALFAFNSQKAKENNFENVALFTYTPSLVYSFKTEDGEDFEISPTRTGITGISVKHKTMTYAIGYEDQDEKSDKRTNFFDVQLAVDFERLLATAYYQNYQGFYFNENGLININNQQNISSVSFGVNLRYFTNEDYDLGKTILSDKRDRVSGGSWFHSAYVNSTKLKNDSDLFMRDGFEDFSGLKQMNVFNTGYEFGYSRTFHFWWMRVTGLFSVGANLHNIHLEKDTNSNSYNTSFSSSAFLDIGLLDLKSTSIGIFVKQTAMSFKYKDIEVDQTRSSATAYIRYFF